MLQYGMIDDAPIYIGAGELRANKGKYILTTENTEKNI